MSWAVIDAGVKRQIVNQVEGHSEICTKTRLAENLRRYANEQKLDCCWVPETFVVSAGYNEGSLHGLHTVFLSLPHFCPPSYIHLVSRKHAIAKYADMACISA